ncbi:hypothetical protein ACEQPO_11240 [Bacillus sp. SL00103]
MPFFTGMMGYLIDQEGSGVEAKLEIGVADLTTEMKNKLLGAETIGGWLETYGKDTGSTFRCCHIPAENKGRFLHVVALYGENSVFRPQKAKQKRIKSNLSRQLLRDNSCPVNLMA